MCENFCSLRILLIFAYFRIYVISECYFGIWFSQCIKACIIGNVKRKWNYISLPEIIDTVVFTFVPL